MLCPSCNTAAMIASAHTAVRHDDTPDMPTEVYTVQEFVCRNRKCPQYGKKIGETQHRLL